MCLSDRDIYIVCPYLFSVYMDDISTVLNGYNVRCYVGHCDIDGSFAIACGRKCHMYTHKLLSGASVVENFGT